MDKRTLSRVLSPVWRRLRLLISRGALKLVDDSHTLQRVQVTLLGDAPAWAERFQQYGITSVPHPGAEVVVAAIGGARAHLVALAVDDRRYRMAALKAGEMAIYDDQGQSVHLTREGIVVKGAGLPLAFTDCPLVTMDGDLQVAGGVTVGEALQVAGSATVDGALQADQVSDAVGSMQGMRDVYNLHAHAPDGPAPRMA
jgi:phage baseplate assembly protein V